MNSIAELLAESVGLRSFWAALLCQREAPAIMKLVAEALAKIAHQDKSHMRALAAASCVVFKGTSGMVSIPKKPRSQVSCDRKRPGMVHTSLVQRRSAMRHGPVFILPVHGALAKRRKIWGKWKPSFSLGPFLHGGEVFTVLPAKRLSIPEDHGLEPLGTELTALVFTYVDCRTKVVALLGASSVISKVMKRGAVWEPLRLERTDVKPFVRNHVLCQKVGMSEVQHVRVELIEPEEDNRSGSELGSGTENERNLFADPFASILMSLFDYSELQEIRITNISLASDSLAIFEFVRAHSLSAFSSVKLNHDSRTNSMVLLASRDVPPQSMSLEAAMMENRSRIPADMHFDETTTLIECEALYLRECASVYKDGDDFFSTLDASQTRSRAVRKHYRPLLSALRVRFPEQFPMASY